MSNVLRKSMESAWLNVLASVLLRLVTFGTTAFVLRHVTAEYLGITVRMVLFMETVLFLSREHFRKACLAKPKDGDWTGLVNLVWLAVPIGAIFCLFFSYLWVHVLDPPSTFVDQYRSAIYICCCTVLLVLCAEPFYMVGQTYMHVRFRSFADLTYLSLGQILSAGAVVMNPERGVINVALAQLCNAGIFLLLHIIYFSHIIKVQAQSPKPKVPDDHRIPFKSLTEFLPTLSQARVDKDRFHLSVSFFKQGFLKQILTDGEKYMFTWFNLMTLSEQGVYDVIANLGSIPARILFCKLEESAHLYFSQTVTRGANADITKEETASRHLHTLVRGMFLFGLVICVFGLSYSHLLLHLYGGALLSTDVATKLLRAHCVSILFLALNGVSECYAFNVMTSEEVSAYNYLMTLMTAIFLAATWVLVKLFGPIGFVVANCCNFSMRIAHNARVIAKRHSVPTAINPLANLLPKRPVAMALAASAVICKLSETFLYEATLWKALMHLVIGGICFLATLVVIVLTEPAVKEKIVKIIGRKKQE